MTRSSTECNMSRCFTCQTKIDPSTTQQVRTHLTAQLSVYFEHVFEHITAVPIEAFPKMLISSFPNVKEFIW